MIHRLNIDGLNKVRLNASGLNVGGLKVENKAETTQCRMMLNVEKPNIEFERQMCHRREIFNYTYIMI